MKLLERTFLLRKEFISAAVENALLTELGRKLKRFRWNDGHFDGKICNYREFMVSDLGEFPALQALVQSDELKALVLDRPLLPVHVLELRRDGIIKAHIDNHAYSGRMIAAVSLGEDSQMTLQRGSECYTINLPRRSFYRQM